MCCAREHYPATVGLHTFDQEPHHHHIILPWRFSQTVCISVSAGNVVLTWRDFCPLEPNKFMGTDQIIGILHTEIGDVADLMAVAVAEGGEIHHQFIKNMIRRYNVDKRAKLQLINPFATDNEFKILRPAEIPEWHEWLVKVAQTEAEGYRAGQQLKEAMRDAHPEF